MFAHHKLWQVIPENGQAKRIVTMKNGLMCVDDDLPAAIFTGKRELRSDRSE
jgi:hypothetical protein